MWHKRVVEKIEECGREFLLHAPLETSKMVFLGILQAFMGLIPIVIEGIYGRSWQPCLVGGTCRGALGEASTSPFFLVKDHVKLNFVLPWWSSLILFLSKASCTFPLVGGNFTWSTNRNPPSWSRIDMFLVYPDWEAKFPDLSQKRLTRLC
jgi:hypothetical protein